MMHLPLRKSYYLLHPIRLIKQVVRNLHNAKMRLKFGFCDYDVWDMDAWFLEVVPPMLRKLADEGMTYPYDDTPEKWHSWLYGVADRLESCKEDKQNERNPYYKEYMKLIEEEINSGNYLKDGTLTLQRDEVRNKYFNKMREIEQESHLVLKECFAELAEHFWELWD